MSKAFGWYWVEQAPWSDCGAWTRGEHDGLPLLSRNCAPKDRLATFRQLRSRHLRPGGHDPVAVLVTKHTVSGATNFSSLWLIDRASEVRPMTPAKTEAVHKALTARRACIDCGIDTGTYTPRGAVRCEDDQRLADQLDQLDPRSDVHDCLAGDATLTAREHEILTELTNQVARFGYPAAAAA